MAPRLTYPVHAPHGEIDPAYRDHLPNSIAETSARNATVEFRELLSDAHSVVCVDARDLEESDVSDWLAEFEHQVTAQSSRADAPPYVPFVALVVGQGVDTSQLRKRWPKTFRHDFVTDSGEDESATQCYLTQLCSKIDERRARSAAKLSQANPVSPEATKSQKSLASYEEQLREQGSGWADRIRHIQEHRG